MSMYRHGRDLSFIPPFPTGAFWAVTPMFRPRLESEINIGIRIKRMPMKVNFHPKSLIASTLLLAALLQPIYAYSADNRSDMIVLCQKDSVSSNNSAKSFKATQLILPATLIAVGSFGACNKDFKRLNNTIKDGMDNLRGDHYLRIDDYVQYLPVASYLGLGFIGVKSKHSFKERLAVGLTSYLSMAAIVNTTKSLAKEPRPDSGTKNSFPSGHTATAFTGAELVREEYGTVAGVGAYTVATGVAFLRLYNGRHWFNDVIAGAGIGILSARIGYWLLPLYQRWFNWNTSTSENSIVLVPSYNHSEHLLSVNLVYTF